MPIDTSRIAESDIPPGDKQARKEERGLAGNRRIRLNRTENIVHWAKIVIIIIFVLVFIAAVVCRILHLFLPAGKKWLSLEEVANIDEFFIHGTIGAIVYEAMKRFLKISETGEGN
jgi:hypothetical protein